jgi:hypothetical protein
MLRGANEPSLPATYVEFPEHYQNPKISPVLGDAGARVVSVLLASTSNARLKTGSTCERLVVPFIENRVSKKDSAAN